MKVFIHTSRFYKNRIRGKLINTNEAMKCAATLVLLFGLFANRPYEIMARPQLPGVGGGSGVSVIFVIDSENSHHRYQRKHRYRSMADISFWIDSL